MSELMFRDHPRRGGALVLRVLAVCLASVASGAVGGFLLIAFFGLVVEESFADVWRAGEWDAIARSGAGSSAAVVIVALGLGSVALGLERLVFMRQLNRDAASSPERIAPWNDRQIVALESPFVAFVPSTVIFLVIDAVTVLIFAFALGESLGSDPESAIDGEIALAVAVALGALVIVTMVLVGKVWRPAWAAATGELRSRWSTELQRSATAAEQGRRPGRQQVVSPLLYEKLPKAVRWIGRGAGAAGALGAVAFFIGLFSRQGCRGCSVRSYDEVGETAIDIVMRVAGLLTLVSILLLAVVLLLDWLTAVISNGILDRRARIAGSGIPQHAVLARALFGWWPGQRAGAVLVGTGWGIAPIIAVTGAVVPGAWPSWLVTALVGLGVAGAVVLLWSDGAAARMRNRMREAWSPGDMIPLTGQDKKDHDAAMGNREPVS